MLRVPAWISEHGHQIVPTKIAGPTGWVLLHGLYESLCETGTFRDNPRARPMIVELLHALGGAFPCIHCRRSIPGFVAEFLPAFNRGEPGRNLMRSLHSRVNKKLWDGGDKSKSDAPDHLTPTYGDVIPWRVDECWSVVVRHFLVYCAMRIDDRGSIDGAVEQDRRPALRALIDRLNEAMTMLGRPWRFDIPQSTDEITFKAPEDYALGFCQRVLDGTINMLDGTRHQRP